MHLTEEQLNIIEEMAYRLIIPRFVAINIEVDEDDFLEEISQPGSQVRKAYYKGLIRHDTDLRESIIKAAHNGSNPAQDQLIRLMNTLISAL